MKKRIEKIITSVEGPTNYTNENIARLQSAEYPYTVGENEFLGIFAARIYADKKAEVTGQDVAIYEYGRLKYTVRPDGSVY